MMQTNHINQVGSHFHGKHTKFAVDVRMEKLSGKLLEKTGFIQQLKSLHHLLFIETAEVISAE